MTRMISFRVSEREFEQLSNKSKALGARSVSDYARVTLCAAANEADGHDGSEILNLKDRIHQLSLEVRRLFDLIEQPREAYFEHSGDSSRQDRGSHSD